MAREQERELIDGVFADFQADLADLAIESHFFVKSFRASAEQAQDWAERVPGDSRKWMREFGSFYFTDLAAQEKNSQPLPGQWVNGIDDVLEALWQGLNSQHLWLLAATYEAFETFVTSLYGVLGYLDGSIWKQSKEHELPRNAMLPQYHATAKKIAHNGVEPLVRQLRVAFAGLPVAEASNPLNWHCEYGTKSIALLRHVIVHCHGRFQRAAFWQRMDVKVWPNAKTAVKASLRRWLEEFLEEEGDMYRLQVLARNQANPTYFFTDRLVARLCSHAALIYSEALSHFNEVPAWRQQTAAD